MNPITKATRRSRIAITLFALAILLLPITGLTGLDALGELKGSASVYVLLLVLVVMCFYGRLASVTLPRVLLVFIAFLTTWIVVDAALNIELIATAALGVRSGGGKFLTSSMVIGFGIAVSIVAAHILGDRHCVQTAFLRPLSWGVLLCAVFAVPELLTWVSPAMTPVYIATTALFHTVETEQGRVIGRLTSITFEAPDLAYFTATALPWLLLGSRLTFARIGEHGRALAHLASVAGLVLLLLSQSRTGFLMLATIVAAETAFWVGLRRLRLPAASISIALAACIVCYVFFISHWISTISATAVANEDVSTITRSALLTAQLSIFAEHPFIGVGFGQYGFYVPDVLPSWAWSSYEIERFFETQGEFPASFNVFGRIGAELGMPGLLIWFGFWITVVHRVAASASSLPDRSFALYVNLAILSSTLTLLVGGISTDAFRRPETWILIAIVSLYAGRSGTRQESV
ncbi:hypothetical protein AFCDBAGC_4841 [Methylobacterium cerastii]|uniref:O-antigen ligase-related domain-containing protein n=1 Tax=Methylobacterium cerastii TaxID=932741 RepID=A0ABQ4QQG0_9HYPH|nr:O-antigen ligase family protein [Methylobacterium cerastii]GJD46956.1 hypothetical protein AFCDBAGC_4841 [Methylobacterium cerastii]